jgi:hypothetical protein
MTTIAEDFLLTLPYNQWIEFKDIPDEFHRGIIEISDAFIWKQRKIEFNDDETAFRIKQA